MCRFHELEWKGRKDHELNLQPNIIPVRQLAMDFEERQTRLAKLASLRTLMKTEVELSQLMLEKVHSHLGSITTSAFNRIGDTLFRYQSFRNHATPRLPHFLLVQPFEGIITNEGFDKWQGFGHHQFMAERKYNERLLSLLPEGSPLKEEAKALFTARNLKQQEYLDYDFFTTVPPQDIDQLMLIIDE